MFNFGQSLVGKELTLNDTTILRRDRLESHLFYLFSARVDAYFYD